MLNALLPLTEQQVAPISFLSGQACFVSRPHLGKYMSAHGYEAERDSLLSSEKAAKAAKREAKAAAKAAGKAADSQQAPSEGGDKAPSV